MGALQTTFQNAGSFVGRLSIETEKGRLLTFNRPHDEQKVLLHKLIQQPTVELIFVLKPRQIGASTLNCAHTYYKTYTARNPLKTLIATDCDDTTDAVFSKIRVFDENLPPGLARVKERSNRKEVIFKDTRAGIRCVTVKGDSMGKGFTFQRLIAEELGYWANAEVAWGSLTSTLHKGPFNQTVIISTPNGPGNLFHRKAQAAMEAAARNDPNTAFLFFRWADHRTYRETPPAGWEPTPEGEELAAIHGLDIEQLYWRHNKIWGPKGIGEEMFRIHYPLTPSEGFRSGGGSWFDLAYLEEVEAEMMRRKPVLGEKRVYKPPQRGMTYAIGADPSWCNGGDEAVAIVLDRDGTVCAVLAQKFGGEDLFAERLADLAQEYACGRKTARVLVEGNKGGAGSVVIKILSNRGVWLWRNPTRGQRRGKEWVTGSGSKADGYAHCRQMVNGDAVELNDLILVQQLSHIRKENNRIEGQGSNHDDHADALMLALWNLRTLPDMAAKPRLHHRRRFAPQSSGRAFDPLTRR